MIVARAGALRCLVPFTRDNIRIVAFFLMSIKGVCDARRSSRRRQCRETYLRYRDSPAMAVSVLKLCKAYSIPILDGHGPPGDFSATSRVQVLVPSGN